MKLEDTSKLVTVVEVPPFQEQSDKVWDHEERYEFIDHIARYPIAIREV